MTAKTGRTFKFDSCLEYQWKIIMVYSTVTFDQFTKLNFLFMGEFPGIPDAWQYIYYIRRSSGKIKSISTYK